MKSKFPWSIDPTEQEIRAIWDEGILTVDANVLLDLYRYHKDTRTALIGSLEEFAGRVWLSHQAAEEFFRNRKKVIVSASNSFQAAEKEISSLQKDVQEPIKSLRSNRIVPDNVADDLGAKLERAFDEATRAISDAKGGYPNYLEEDPILTGLLALFDSSVGEPFSSEDLDAHLAEAKRRADKKIPPGYLDAKKDGDRPYGDYIMWRQMLDKAKESGTPLIFVTSENKEDWWERASGKTTGVLYELIKESHEETGQRFLFYRTDRFLEFAAKRSGAEADESAVAEIRKIVRERSSSVPAVRVVGQFEEISEPHLRYGVLEVEILRPTFSFTCSGHLEPHMAEAPEIRVALADHPEGLPDYKIHAGTGTTFDFNIHLKPKTHGEIVPVGTYRFEYRAHVPLEMPDEVGGEKI